jgi:uncharacterized protein (TIRG00374 family)
MRLRSIVIWSLLLGLVAVALIIINVGADAVVAQFARASLMFLGAYLLVSITIAVVLTLRWKLILHSQGLSVAFWKLFTYRLMGYSVSYLTPTAHVGGEWIRAFLLAREDIDTNTAVGSVIIDKSVELMVNVLFFFLGAVLIINNVLVEERFKLVTLVISLSLILLTGMLIGGILGPQSVFLNLFRTLRLHRIKRLQPIQQNLVDVEKIVEKFFRERPWHFIACIGIVALLWALMFVEYKIALLIFDHDASLLDIFLILTGVGIAYSIPIPAAVGALELGQLSTAKVANLADATGLALAFLVRARDLVWTVIGLIFLSAYELNFLKLSRKQRRIDAAFESGNLIKEAKRKS